MKTAVMILYWLAPSELAVLMSEPKYEVTDGHLGDFSEYLVPGQTIDEAFDNLLRAIGKHQPFVEMVVNMAREREVSDDEIEELLVSILSAVVRRDRHGGRQKLWRKWFGSGNGTSEPSPSSTAAIPMSAATSFLSTATKVSGLATSFSSAASNSSPATTAPSSSTTSHSGLYHELTNVAHFDRSFTKSPDGSSRWKTSTPSTTHSLPLIRELSPRSHAYHCLESGSSSRARSENERRSLDGQQRQGYGHPPHPNSFPTYMDKGFKTWFASNGAFPSKETTTAHNMSSGTDHRLDDKENLKHASAKEVFSTNHEGTASLAHASYQSFATGVFDQSELSPSIKSHGIQDNSGVEESIDYLSLLENQFPGAITRISDYQGSIILDEVPEIKRLVRPLQLPTPSNDIQALAYEDEDGDAEQGFPTPSTDANEILRYVYTACGLPSTKR